MEAKLIILAAGNSSRMGHPKGLVNYGGKTLLEYQIEHFALAGGRYAYLILGHHIDHYRDFFKIKGHQFQISGVKIDIIKNNYTKWGPFYSLQLGLAATSAPVLMTPIDSPMPSKELIKKLSASTKSAAVPIYQKRKGHPVFISSQLAQELKTYSPQESRLDHILKNLNDLELIETEEERVCFNFNTPECLHSKSN